MTNKAIFSHERANIYNLHHLHLTLTAKRKNIYVNNYKIIVKIVQCFEYYQCSVSPQKEWILHKKNGSYIQKDKLLYVLRCQE